MIWVIIWIVLGLIGVISYSFTDLKNSQMLKKDWVFWLGGSLCGLFIFYGGIKFRIRLYKFKNKK
jgi:hypothetical protein